VGGAHLFRPTWVVSYIHASCLRSARYMLARMGFGRLQYRCGRSRRGTPRPCRVGLDRADRRRRRRASMQSHGEGRCLRQCLVQREHEGDAMSAVWFAIGALLAGTSVWLVVRGRMGRALAETDRVRDERDDAQRAAADRTLQLSPRSAATCRPRSPGSRQSSKPSATAPTRSSGCWRRRAAASPKRSRPRASTPSRRATSRSCSWPPRD